MDKTKDDTIKEDVVNENALDSKKIEERDKSVKGTPVPSVAPSQTPVGSQRLEMTVKLDTTMQKYNEDGGNDKFIKTVTSALKINPSLMKVTNLRSGSVYVTFTVDTDDSISLKSLKS
jgi:hypothetical protein